jgi:hypothetical protein
MIYPKQDLSYKFKVEPAIITAVYKDCIDKKQCNDCYVMHLSSKTDNYIFKFNKNDILNLVNEYNLDKHEDLRANKVMVILNEDKLAGIVSEEFAKRAVGNQLLNDYYQS